MYLDGTTDAVAGDEFPAAASSYRMGAT